jgi:TonB family protein
MAAQSRGFSAVASATIHLGAALLVLVALRVSPQPERSDVIRALIPAHLVWVPHVDTAGGGKSGGGDRSITPPRRAREVGTDAASVPVIQTQPSLTAIQEPLQDVPEIPLEPMADAMAAAAGVLDGGATTNSAGPGSTGAGDHTGNDRGAGGDRPGNGFGPGVLRGGPGVTIPTLIEQVRPKYTADAMRARIQGSVWIECVVLPDGTVGDARVMRSLDRHFGLDEEALKAARLWRFRPGRLRGEPVPVVVTIELMFSVR